MRPCFQAAQGFFYTTATVIIRNLNDFFLVPYFGYCSLPTISRYGFVVIIVCIFCFVLFFISFCFSATLLSPGKKSILPACVLPSQSCQSRVLQSLHSDLTAPHLQNFESGDFKLMKGFRWWGWWQWYAPLHSLNFWTCLPGFPLYSPWIYGQDINEGSHEKEDLYLLYISIRERTMFLMGNCSYFAYVNNKERFIFR